MKRHVVHLCSLVVVGMICAAIGVGGCNKHKKHEDAPKGEPKVTTKTEAPAAAPAPVVKPADAPKPTVAESASLYERLGGEPAIRAVVVDFVGRAAGNPKVNFTREGVAGAKTWPATPENVKKVTDRLIQFVANVTGGPQKYEGQDMLTVHKGMKITNAQFDAIAGDLQASLKKFKVPEKEINELMTIAAGTRQAIVEEGDPKPATKPASTQPGK